jgi:hypothetical protein
MLLTQTRSGSAAQKCIESGHSLNVGDVKSNGTRNLLKLLEKLLDGFGQQYYHGTPVAELPGWYRDKTRKR